MKIKTTMPSVRSAFLTGVSFLGLTVGASAQEPGRYFNIPDQAAASAIPEFARSADVQIIVSADDIEGKRVHGLRGTYPVREALNRMMDGTNIRVQNDDGKTIVLGNGDAKKNVQLAQAASPDAVTVETVVVTASKRAEDIQNTPMSVQAVTNKQLGERTVNNFQDYVKFLPAVSFQANNGLQGGGSSNIIYMRGISDGSYSGGGPLPSVGTYLDEQPISDIGGTLNVHIYDIARLEVLPGPQGTLYGASSESGTLKIVTNQPSTDGFSGSVNLQANTIDHGGQGYVGEGYLNIPLNEKMAIRLVAFDEYDAGYIDNVPASRTFASSKQTATNAGLVQNDFNNSRTYGGRAALKIDLDEDWTVTPSVMAQATRGHGINAYEPGIGFLQVARFTPDSQHDEWVQSSLTVTGKIADLDVTYSGAHFERSTVVHTDYTDYSVFYDALYGSAAGYTDNSGKIVGTPLLPVTAHIGYTKTSNELRIASPQSDRFRFIAGLFQETLTNNILEPYVVQNLADAKSVQGFANATFLIDTHRSDNDAALFGEATYDLTDHISVLAGLRLYDYHNIQRGYYSFRTSAFGTPGSKCSSAIMFKGAPCTTYDKTANGEGETHKLNVTYKFDDDALVYATYSTGFRAGGINRNPAFGAYDADNLSNYELGWKTGWLGHSILWNGSLYYEDWSNFQFAFHGPQGISIYQNAPSAAVYGLETSLDYAVTNNLTLTGGANYNYARITQDFCGVNATTLQPIQNCAGIPIQVRAGTPLVFTPRFKGSLSARYTFDLGGWAAHIQASGQYRGPISNYITTSDIASAGTSNNKLGDFATADLSFGVANEGRRIEIFSKNLFNSHGSLGSAASCVINVCGVSTVPNTPPAVYRTPLQPLTIGVKVEQDF
jgi:outer membrane receptor protein involved in Fe transport